MKYIGSRVLHCILCYRESHRKIRRWMYELLLGRGRGESTHLTEIDTRTSRSFGITFKLHYAHSKVQHQDAVWTSFEMTLRVPAPMATKPLDFARFCATSITFKNHIRQISVFIDQHPLFTISKVSRLTKRAVPLRGLRQESPRGYVTLKSISMQSKAFV